jgi:hypothetical protein
MHAWPKHAADLDPIAALKHPALRCAAPCSAVCLLSVLLSCASPVCPAGRYSPDGSFSCVDCPLQHYCTGGVFNGTQYPDAIRCPANMTTRGRRSTSVSACRKYLFNHRSDTGGKRTAAFGTGPAPACKQQAKQAMPDVALHCCAALAPVSAVQFAVHNGLICVPAGMHYHCTWSLPVD